MKTLNTIWFPLRFETKVMQQTAQWLGNLTSSQRLLVLSDFTHFTNFLGTPEGEKWRKDNQSTFHDIVNYALPFEHGHREVNDSSIVVPADHSGAGPDHDVLANVGVSALVEDISALRDRQFQPHLTHIKDRSACFDGGKQVSDHETAHQLSFAFEWRAGREASRKGPECGPDLLFESHLGLGSGEQHIDRTVARATSRSAALGMSEIHAHSRRLRGPSRQVALRSLTPHWDGSLPLVRAARQSG